MKNEPCKKAKKSESDVTHLGQFKHGSTCPNQPAWMKLVPAEFTGQTP